MATRTPIVLHYWKIPGRASLAYVLFRAGNIPVEYLDEDQLEVKETYKEAAPFGQLPFLLDKDHGVSMAQSAAIVAYAARIAGLEGDNLVHYSETLMYLELEAELMSFCGKALYTGEKGSAERTAAWEDAKKKVDVKLQKVERNLGSNQFIGGTAKPLAADFAIANLTWFLSLPSLWPSLKSEFPKLSSHLDAVLAAYPAAAETFKEMEQWEAYYIRS
jgi:glutathione S-transferase